VSLSWAVVFMVVWMPTAVRVVYSLACRFFCAGSLLGRQVAEKDG